ncbi:sensor domain-containing protein [Mycobacteroides saopaulense]|uniref:sensor domain-containing protein n=1 Tax=Mycobacteroides saopaulense TaxID=1578165 RepID=UPI0009F1BAA6|nr:sensor domain-containing protein [Mycobacteroides saopaulense]
MPTYKRDRVWHSVSWRKVYLCLTLSVCLGTASACADSKVAAPKTVSADSLVVSTEDVESISNFRGFTQDGFVKKEQPATLDPNAPDVCKIIFDQTAVFGGGLKDFRSVVYSGTAGGYIKSINQITQSVGVYSDAEAARSAFDRLMPDMVKCSEAHIKNYEFTLTRPDSSTIFLDSKYWKAAYRAKSTVLATTSTVGFQHPELVTQGVLDAITDNVP